jgi:hypothetical protein
MELSLATSHRAKEHLKRQVQIVPRKGELPES